MTVALLMAVAAAESGRPTMTFLAKEAVRLTVDGFTRGVACDGCPPLPALLDRYAAAGGRFGVYPVLWTPFRPRDYSGVVR